MNQTNKGTYDNEIDLWNLEDDHSSTAPTVTPVEENSTPEKTEDVANTKTQDKFVANDEESKPFAETDEATDSRVSEDHQPAVERSISVQSIVSLASRVTPHSCSSRPVEPVINCRMRPA